MFNTISYFIGTDTKYSSIDYSIDNTTGECIAWKAGKSDNTFVYIEILVPTDAKCVTTHELYKCRISHGKVLSITDREDNKYDYAKSFVYNSDFEYKVNMMVYPDKFDDNPDNSCSHGISVHKYKVHCDQWYNDFLWSRSINNKLTSWSGTVNGLSYNRYFLPHNMLKKYLNVIIHFQNQQVVSKVVRPCRHKNIKTDIKDENSYIDKSIILNIEKYDNYGINYVIPYGSCNVYKLCKYNDIFLCITIRLMPETYRVTMNNMSSGAYMSKISHGLVLNIIDQCGNKYNYVKSDDKYSMLYIIDSVIFSDKFNYNPNRKNNGILVFKHKYQLIEYVINVLGQTNIN